MTKIYKIIHKAFLIQFLIKAKKRNQKVKKTKKKRIIKKKNSFELKEINNDQSLAEEDTLLIIENQDTES